MSLKVVEIFRSIQGEGANAGMDATFIRLAGCNMKCSYCDTDFSKGKTYSIDELLKGLQRLGSKNIIWTGGEPTLQLNREIISVFKQKDYYQAIETNGSNPVPKGIDYIACSPKVGLNVLKKNIEHADEFRYPFGVNVKEPPAIHELPPAKHYFVSPIFDGTRKNHLNKSNLKGCLEFIKAHPEWKISVQVHKLLNIP
jgi:organic radical activating enzyme